MNVLFLTPRSPRGAASGGLQVTRERIRRLSAVANVTVVHLMGGPQEARCASAMPGDVEQYCAGELRPRSLKALLASYAARLPISVWRNADAGFTEIVERLAAATAWDLVYVDHWLVFEAARRVENVPRVLHLHNAEPALFDRAAAGMSPIRGYMSRREAARAATYLRDAVECCAELHLLSAEDRDVLASYGVRHHDTKLFPPGVDAVDGPVPGFSERAANVLYVGSLSWYPNAEGLRWYLRCVCAHDQGIDTMDIVGAEPDESVRAMVREVPRAILHGYVADVSPYYAQARCLVAPLQSGSGIKVKILNALARGLPVVTTPIGVEGMPDNGGPGVFVGRTPAEFAALVRVLVSDEEAWRGSSAAAQSYVARHFSGEPFAVWCTRMCGN